MNQQCAFARKFRLAVIMLAALLATSLAIAGLAPATAHASGTTTVWVITKVKTDYGYTDTCSYYKNGLIKSDTFFGEIYAYDKKNHLKSITRKEDGKTFATITYKLDKKGRAVKSTYKPIKGGSYTNGVYKYDSKGRLLQHRSLLSGNELYFKDTYSYDAKGRIKAIVEKHEEALGGTHTFTYDSKGNIVKDEVKYVDGSSDAITYKNIYKNGRLKKVTVNESGDKKTTTYTYKKVSIPKSLVKMVQSQQLALKSHAWAELSSIPVASAHQ